MIEKKERKIKEFRVSEEEKEEVISSYFENGMKIDKVKSGDFTWERYDVKYNNEQISKLPGSELQKLKEKAKKFYENRK